MNIVCFDFDGTLVKKETFKYFIIESVNKKSLIKSLPSCLLYYCNNYIINRNATLFKNNYFPLIFGNKEVNVLKNIGKKYIDKNLYSMINKEVFNLFLKHKDNGDICCLISASPNIYIDYVGEKLEFDYTFSTELEIKNNILTGKIIGESCYRNEKVNRIKTILSKYNYEKIIAYGNSIGDKEMLEYADEGYLIKKNYIIKV